MYARIVTAGQEKWYHNVVTASADRDVLTLTLNAHPHQVHYWIGGEGARTSVLLAATGEDVTAMLREEHPNGAWSGQ